jgi:hypothetical protein
VWEKLCMEWEGVEKSMSHFQKSASAELHRGGVWVR